MADAQYFRDRYAARQLAALKKLGGACSHCGTEDNLEFDHKDPATKEFQIGSSTGGNCSEERFWKEVEKCQLLCSGCHSTKTIYESGRSPAKDTHGTLSSYKYCKCDLCKKAMSDYNKKYYRNR